MSDRPPNPDDRRFDPDADERPGSDPGAAYDRAVDEGEVTEPHRDDDTPGPGEVHRSGS